MLNRIEHKLVLYGTASTDALIADQTNVLIILRQTVNPAYKPPSPLPTVVGPSV